MTPRAFFLLLDRYKADRKHDMYCAAMQVAAIYNVNRSSKTDPVVTPEDIVGDDKPARKQTPEDMLMLVRQVINPALGGKDTQRNG